MLVELRARPEDGAAAPGALTDRVASGQEKFL
jgi:hypothetical protein